MSCITIKGYFIQYKFILPESISHSSYTYQKLFRSLYGYTQVVDKSNGKSYKYHRPGVLSLIPYVRPGKNCVIIPPGALQKLTTFFKTGKNPTHTWRIKGDWKAVYYMNEKEVEIKDTILALEQLIDRSYVETTKSKKSLLEEMERAINNPVNSGYRDYLLSSAKEITSHPWFAPIYSGSKKLSSFKSAYDSLRKG